MVASLPWKTNELGIPRGYCSRAAVFFAVAMIVFDCVLSGRLSFASLFALDVFLFLFFAVVVYSFRFLLDEDESLVRFNLRRVVGFVSVALVGGMILEAMTLLGSPLHSVFRVEDWSIKKLFAFIVVAYLLEVVFVTLFTKITHKSQPLNKVYLAKSAVAICAVLALSLLCGYLLQVVAGLAFVPAFLFCTAVLLVLPVVVCSRKSYAPEKVFLAMALSVGGYMACVFPPETGISWDDQIHYERALAVSYVNNSVICESDSTLLDPHAESDTVHRPDVGSWNQPDVEAYIAEINKEYQDGTRVEIPGFRSAAMYEVLSYTTLGYIPSAVGLWIGRFLHLPFTAIFVLGRLFNLFMYVAVCYAAIKISPSKKVLISCVALLPTNLFLAASYSYDPWVTAFILLACAFLGRASIGNRASVRDLFFCGMSFFVGLGPKAIYFPLVGLMLLVPRNKFPSKRSHALFLLLVMALGLLVVFSFVLPFVSSSAYSGDVRGGGDVSSSGQLAYIMDNPASFLLMLTGFVFGKFLNLANSYAFSFNYGYLGTLLNVSAFVSAIVPVFLAVVAILDARREDELEKMVLPKAWTALLVLATAALVSISLYVSFTPVGLGTVNGVQFRYLLPLLFPFYAVCFSFPVIVRMNRARFGIVCMGCMWAMGLICTASLALVHMTV